MIESIDLALDRGNHVAINYLNCPGCTDSPEEYDALKAFLEAHPVQMIQWRNLNFDPLRYTRRMGAAAPHGRPMGAKYLLNQIQTQFPRVRFGYFNPPKETFR